MGYNGYLTGYIFGCGSMVLVKVFEGTEIPEGKSKVYINNRQVSFVDEQIDNRRYTQTFQVDTIESGVMTGDLALLSTLPNIKKVGTEEFLLEVNETLKKLM